MSIELEHRFYIKLVRVAQLSIYPLCCCVVKSITFCVFFFLRIGGSRFISRKQSTKVQVLIQYSKKRVFETH